MATTFIGMCVPGSGLLKRLASAAVGIPAFVWVVWGAPAWFFSLLVIGIGGVASWELARMFERAGWPVSPWLGAATGAVVTASFLVPGGPTLALTAAVFVTLSAPLMRLAPLSAEPGMATIFGLTYVSWLLGHALLLHARPDGVGLILFLVGVTWVGESTAYGVGSTVGRRLLAPAISPGKTVEGALAQFVVSVAAALLLGPWLLPAWSLPTLSAAGALLGVVGQIGDLAESAIKRSLGAKDAGGLIPGHGGLLDRIDGLLFNVAAFFYFVTYVRSGP